jgi:threonine/homoserine/homoserine lactone efflux protein
VTTLVAIVPSAGALFLFWIALRAMLQADRRERLAQARIEAAEDRAAAEAAQAAQTTGTAGTAASAERARTAAGDATGPQS